MLRKRICIFLSLSLTIYCLLFNYQDKEAIADMKKYNEARVKRNLKISLTKPGRGQTPQLSAHPLNVLNSILKTI